MTAKHIKELFNGLAKQNDRQLKYKRCINNTKFTVMFEVYNMDTIIFSHYYDFKLLSFNTVTKISVYYCKQKDIDNMYKYNLKENND